jgi:hypothetical protein
MLFEIKYYLCTFSFENGNAKMNYKIVFMRNLEKYIEDNER